MLIAHFALYFRAWSQGGDRINHYNVNFSIAGGDSELVCQYKIVFRPDGTVESTHWRRHTCENLAQTLTVPPPAEAKPEPKVQVVTLSADILFGFGESELTSQGKDRLREVAENLQAAYQNPMVTLIGHTDRLGSFDSNMGLSQRRAEAVRRQLAKSGLSNSAMIAEGRGETEPVVVIPTHEHLRHKLCELYENDCIFDKFECCTSGDGKNIMTGSYCNHFNIYDREGKHETSMEVSRIRPRASSTKALTKGRRKDASAIDVNDIDFGKKVLHFAWHPTTNCVAVAGLNNLYIYNA